MRDVTLLSIKIKFVHPAKFRCIMLTLNKLFKTEFERGKLEKSPFFLTDIDPLNSELKKYVSEIFVILSEIEKDI